MMQQYSSTAAGKAAGQGSEQSDSEKESDYVWIESPTGIV
jgi:hypothetical protein